MLDWKKIIKLPFLSVYSSLLQINACISFLLPLNKSYRWLKGICLQVNACRVALIMFLELCAQNLQNVCKILIICNTTTDSRRDGAIWPIRWKGRFGPAHTHELKP